MGGTKKNKLISREEFRNISSGVAADVIEKISKGDIIEDLKCMSGFAAILSALEYKLFDEKEK